MNDFIEPSTLLVLVADTAVRGIAPPDRVKSARPGDRAAAENVIRDMQNALGGK